MVEDSQQNNEEEQSMTETKIKKALITQSNYIPWKGYFDSINDVDIVVLYDDVQYTRRDWRNRNKIKTPQGTQWLTIPVDVKNKYDQSILDTKINDPTWNQKHWKTITYNYARAEHYGATKELFESLYMECNEERLSMVNHRFLTAICDYLGINTEFRWSHEFELPEDRNLRLIKICKDLDVTEYHSGEAAKFYLDEDAFNAESINVKWLNHAGYKEYSQLFGNFAHAVSILDLIFNEGPEAINYMKSFD